MMFDTSYQGSTLLQPVADRIGLRIDQLNFIVCQLFALVISPFMRHYLHPSKVSETQRHLFSCVTGLSLVYFCFGSEIWYILALAMFSYAVITKVDTKNSHRIIFIVSMVYLAARHMQRMIMSYGSYHLDVTGSLMIIVQKITGLAFSLHDGTAVKEDQLSPYRKKHVIKNVPSFLEFYSYIFQYQCILAGPNVFYIDYLHFIKGDNFKIASDENSVKQKSGKKIQDEPAATYVVLRKLAVSFACIAVHLTLSPRYPVDKLRDHSFLNQGFFYKFGYMLLMSLSYRFMYYHAWTLADAICNASGFGFSGYSKDGTPNWDLTSNIDIINFELGENLRSSISAWNTGANMWLRFIVYERVKSHNTLLTFVLSAVWHGFYPGYYITFITAALFVAAARTVRKHIRPFFLKNKALKQFYDVLTIVFTRFALSYISLSFILLDFWSAFYVYKSLYFFMHVLGLLALFVIPLVMPKSPNSSKEKSG